MLRWATMSTVIFCLLTVTACDTTEFDDEDEDLREAGVFAVELEFNLDDVQVEEDEYGTGIAYAGYNMPEITSSVVRDGAVLVYIRDEVGTWKALPFTQGYEKVDEPVVDFTYTLNYAYEPGLLDVFVTASTADPVIWDDIRDTALFEVPRTLKVVIIGEFAAARAQSSGVDLQSYSEVEAHFDFEEAESKGEGS